jgi:hypothetical protein
MSVGSGQREGRLAVSAQFETGVKRSVKGRVLKKDAHASIERNGTERTGDAAGDDRDEGDCVLVGLVIDFPVGRLHRSGDKRSIDAVSDEL